MLEYSLKSVEIESAGTGYSVNDQLTIDLDTKDAKLKVTSVSAGEPTNVAVANRALAVTGYFDETTGTFIPSDDPQYAMSGYAVGDTFTMSVAQGDTSPVFTVASVEDGVITGLTVTTAGSITIDSDHSDTFDDFLDSDSWTYLPSGENHGGGAILHVYFSRVYEGGGEVEEVVIVDHGESTTSTVENPVSVTGGTGSDATFNITLAEVFEEVEVTDVPGTMPKPATEVSYVSYSVSYPELPIDYNTAFTREYPVQG